MMINRFKEANFCEEAYKKLSLCRFCIHISDDYCDYGYPDEQCEVCACAERTLYDDDSGCGVLIQKCKEYQRKPDVYKQYLNSEMWKETKRKLQLKKGLKCEMCGSCININVHHANYDHIGFEDESELFVLCNECHKRLHEGKKEKDGEADAHDAS